MAYSQKLLQFAIQLAQGSGGSQPTTFAGTSSDTLNISNARAKVRIRNSGGASQCSASIQIYGLSQSQMQQLSTLGMTFSSVPKNTITVKAGDNPSQLSQIFSGTIMAAYADYNAAPDVPFNMECLFGGAQAVANAASNSYSGGTSVVTIAQTLAQQLGLTFENNGIENTQLYNPVFNGSLMSQLADLRDHADIGVAIDTTTNTLAIFPKFGSRTVGAPTPVVIAPPPIGNMIGYPTFTQQGMIVKNLFDPTIKFFGKVSVQSSVVQTATWVVNKMDLSLDTLVPKGDWMAVLFCYGSAPAEPIIPPP